MTDKLIGGVKSAGPEKQIRIITTMFILLMIAGPAVTHARDGYSPETSESQQRKIQITGTVVDDKTGESIIGANVMEKGTGNGTVTDVDGHFSLSVTENATLQVSYVGYITQEIGVSSSTGRNLSIKLEEDTRALDEVVVVGYGVQKKSNVTGAIASVKADEIVNRSNETVGSALQGKLAGVQILNTSGAPGASATFRIRGFSSTVSSPDPLFIVDGLKVNDIDYLDPNGIESIEVLKDAASAAIYGAQAGNGVVLITTRKGSEGYSKVSYNNMFTFSAPASRVDMMNAAQFKEYWTEYGQYGEQSFQNGDTNWQDVMFETGVLMRHTVGVQGGNNKGSFYVEATYLSNDGIVTGSNDVNKRVTAQINADYKIKPWLKFGVTNSIERGYMHRVSDNNFAGTGSAVAGAYYFDPTVPVFYQNDSDAPASLNLVGAEAAGYNVFRNVDGKLYGQSVAMMSNLWNPLLMRDTQDTANDVDSREFWRTNINGTAFAEITPFDGFVFTSRLGYRFFTLYAKGYAPPYYIHAQQISTAANVIGQNFNNIYYQWENFANYNKSFGKHDVSAMAGFEYANNRIETVNARANGLTNLSENFHYLEFYDPNASIRTMGGTDYYRANTSYFARVAYTYANKYNLQVSFRGDAYDMSKLSKENRWGYFPSVSAGWTITNEGFLGNYNRNLLSFLKLRGSYGINGNINSLTDFTWTNTMSLDGLYSLNNRGMIMAANPSEVLANPNLTWEESRQYDLGIDMRFLKDRLTLSVDYYDRVTTGMLTSIDAPAVSGTSSQWVNRGRIKNTGFEFDLGWRSRIGKDFTYGITSNLSTVKNEVVESPLGAGRTEGGDNFFMPVTFLEAGYPMYSIRTYVHKEIDRETGLPVYYTAEELGTNDGRDYVGSGIPDFTYGLTVNVKYKNVDLTIFGSGVQGNEMFLAAYRPDLPIANLPAFVFNNRWTPENRDNPLFPKANMQDGSIFTGGRYPMSDFWVFDASYFKVKQIQLGYTLPQALVRRIGIQDLRIYASGENLFTFTEYKGNDPESMSATYGSSIGIDRINYPSTRNYIFGLNLSF
ncbi:MAG: TonB-dependent receptor [Tannerella sp.]|jgi:TonB-linked SusC/RagA family outer membrane protein|nr:TonB-dependent receptor [Tannerella sp.]